MGNIRRISPPLIAYFFLQVFLPLFQNDLMPKLFLLISFSFSLVAGSDYFNLIQKYPEAFGRTGCWKLGEIEIATQPEEIKRIEKFVSQRFIRMGYPEEIAQKYSACGIVAEDHYWIWIRDAVTFPGGIPGTYDRIIRKSELSGVHGTVILPVLENKKILVIVNFRHATRSWEMELPRGARKNQETPEQTAARQLDEETGCLAKEFTYLGDVAPSTSIINGTIPVYFARIVSKKSRHQDESEAIALNIEMTEAEIEEGFLKGYLLIPIHGQLTKVYCRDPFFCFAFLQAKWRKLI